MPFPSTMYSFQTGGSDVVAVTHYHSSSQPKQVERHEFKASLIPSHPPKEDVSWSPDLRRWMTPLPCVSLTLFCWVSVSFLEL